MTRVFVYGSLKQGFGNHCVIADQQFIAEAKTEDNAWYMFSLGGFPGVVAGNCQVTGEIYEVDEDGLASLDQLESNGDFYQREVVNTTEGEAWMYILLCPDQYRQSDRDVETDDEGVQTWIN